MQSMGRAVIILVGALVAVAMMVGAIWSWIDLADWALAGRRPDILIWAARSLAIAGAAGAQVVILTFVVGRLYRIRAGHDGWRLAAALVCCVAAVSAAALGLADQGYVSFLDWLFNMNY